MTQTEAILEHMKRYGSITPLEALQEYGCMRLGARIWDLKRAGYRIGTTIVTRINSDGEAKRFARYDMEEKTA